MIYRMFFPKGGGGWARRYLQFRRDRSRIFVESTDREPGYKPITLFDFTRDDDAVDARRLIDEEYGHKTEGGIKKKKKVTADGWRISDDRVIGGYSESFVEFIEPGQTHQATTKEENIDESLLSPTTTSAVVTREKDHLDHSSFPFLRFYGTIDTQVGYFKTGSIHRSGFAAIRTPEYASSLAPGTYLHTKKRKERQNKESFLCLLRTSFFSFCCYIIDPF